jgi:hypothetical protein
MSAPFLDPSGLEWISGRAACNRLRCASNALLLAALRGLIRTKLEPGIPPRYNRADVERLAQQPKTPHERRRNAGQEARHE